MLGAYTVSVVYLYITFKQTEIMKTVAVKGEWNRDGSVTVNIFEAEKVGLSVKVGSLVESIEELEVSSEVFDNEGVNAVKALIEEKGYTVISCSVL